MGADPVKTLPAGFVLDDALPEGFIEDVPLTPEQRSVEIQANIQAGEQRLAQSFPGLYDGPPSTQILDETVDIDPVVVESIYEKTKRDRARIINELTAIHLDTEAWGVKTQEEARDIVSKRALLEGKRTLGEEIREDAMLDALAILPFSPLHEWEKRGYAEAKRRLREGDYETKYQMTPMGGYSMVQKGASREELLGVVRDYELEQARGQTIGATVGKGAAMLPGYIGEFAAGGALTKSLGLVGTLPSKAPAVVKIAKAVSNALTQAGVTTMIQPHRVNSALVDQELRGEKGMTAVAKAYGSVYIENLTELTGESFNVVGKSIIDQLPMGAKIFSRMQQAAAKIGIDEATFLGRVAQKGGWNGLLGEMGEERVNTILYGIFSIDDFGAGPDSTIRERVAAGLKQDLEAENMLVETLVLMTPGGVKVLAKQASRLYPENPEIAEAMNVLEQAVEADQEQQQTELAATEAGEPAVQPETPAAPVAARPETAEPVATPEKMTLDEFEAAGYRPADITKQQWVDMMRRRMRSLGRPEESGTEDAPYGDWELYWEQDVARQLAEEVTPTIKESLTVQPEKGVSNAVQGQETRPQGPVTTLGQEGAKQAAQGEGAAAALSTEQRAPAQPDENLRRSELAKTTKAIHEHPAYKLGVEQAEAQGYTPTSVKDRVVFVEPKYEGDVIGYAGEDRRGKLWRHITFDKNKGAAWDSLAEEAGLPTDFDGFMQWLKDAVESGGRASINEKAMETALSSREPDLELLALKHNLLKAGWHGASINEELEKLATDLAVDYGLTEDTKNDILDKVKIRGKYAEEVSQPNENRLPGQVQATEGPAPRSVVKRDTGVFGQTIVRPATGTQQGLLPDTGEEWVGREPERPLLEGLEAPQQPPGAKEGVQPSAKGEIGPPAGSGATVEGDSGSAELPPGIAEQAKGEPLPQIGGKNADTRALRNWMGLDGIPSPEKQTRAQWLQEAKERKFPEHAVDIALDALAQKRGMTPQEHEGLMFRLWQLTRQGDDLASQERKAGTDADKQSVETQRKEVESQVELITRALIESGTPEARAMVSRQAMLDDTGNLTNNLARAKINKGKDLTAKERAKVEELTAQIVALQTENARLTAEQTKSEAEGVRKHSRSRSRWSKMDPAKKDAELTRTKEKLRKLLEAGC